jgi:uncharacterized membrane protein YbhN (UPF0104 family)
LWSLRAIVLAAVVAGVAGTIRDAFAQLSEFHWAWRPAWAVAAGALYIFGLAPMAWFWRKILKALQQPVPWCPVLRAYYYGHLGKYVPGKALVVVIRVTSLQRWVGSIWLTVVAVLAETLAMMAVGAFLAAVLAIVGLPLRPGIAALALPLAAASFLATLPAAVRRLVLIGWTRWQPPDGDPLAGSAAIADAVVRGINWRLWACGWLAAAMCWTALGLSLWATLRSIGVDKLPLLANLPFLVGAVSLAVVAGFLSLLPGGIVVRDALLMRTLAPACGEANALVAAVFLRIIWLMSELAVCAILYGAARRAR